MTYLSAKRITPLSMGSGDSKFLPIGLTGEVSVSTNKYPPPPPSTLLEKK